MQVAVMGLHVWNIPCGGSILTAIYLECSLGIPDDWRVELIANSEFPVLSSSVRALRLFERMWSRQPTDPYAARIPLGDSDRVQIGLTLAAIASLDVRIISPRPYATPRGVDIVLEMLSPSSLIDPNAR